MPFDIHRNDMTLVRILSLNPLFLTGKLDEVLATLELAKEACQKRGYENLEIHKCLTESSYWVFGSVKPRV